MSTSFTQNLIAVQQRLHEACQRSGRQSTGVQLLAVSKTQPASAIREAFATGQRAFGENYLQEALEKIAQLSDLAIEWHFIGQLQSNKTRPVATHFDWVHSVDSLKLARRLGEQRPAGKAPVNICLQVNISGEASKSGVTPDAVPALVEAIAPLPGVRLRGLMAIPAPCPPGGDPRAPFHAMHALLSRLQKTHPELDTLSMGMSADLDAAIAEGATIIRIGTALFGPRNPTPSKTPADKGMS